jgi:hypothetical protein
MLQHVVTRPDSTPHRAVKFGDALLLLMDTLVAVRAGTRLILFDPPVDPTVCDACAAAYAEARRRSWRPVGSCRGSSRWGGSGRRRRDLPALAWRRADVDRDPRRRPSVSTRAAERLVR